MPDTKVVSVFGGAQPKPGSAAYTEAEELGRQLARAGYAVMSGGYAGTMEAVSKGAKEAGGHVIGVTVGQIERQFGSILNDYVDEVIHYDTLYERLHHLVGKCGAAVALRGGIGTLSEVTLLWSLMQVGEVATIPLVLLGQHWADVLDTFVGDGAYIRPQYRSMYRLAHSPSEAVTLLERWE
jgi:uncharacterized protein (TIGR00730 family)